MIGVFPAQPPHDEFLPGQFLDVPGISARVLAGHPELSVQPFDFIADFILDGLMDKGIFNRVFGAQHAAFQQFPGGLGDLGMVFHLLEFCRQDFLFCRKGPDRFAQSGQIVAMAGRRQQQYGAFRRVFLITLGQVQQGGD